MNLQNIRTICESKQVKLKHLAESIGITEQGLHQCIRRKSIQAGIFEQIAIELNVSIREFFDEKFVERNDANANGNGSAATNRGNVSISNYAQPTAEACAMMSSARGDELIALRERCKFYESKIEDMQKLLDEKERIINLLMKC